MNPVLCRMRGRLALGGGFRERFDVFGVGLAPIPLFVGTEMLLDDLVKTPVAASLATVTAILAASIAASPITRRRAIARAAA
ncbi:MAG: hypothetical protein N2544_10760 [Burkholderiales bacterium]|nr:hypothetical protein [Burkholderiales bacterium]